MRQMKQESSGSTVVSSKTHCVVEEGLHPQPFGVARAFNSTPPQTFPFNPAKAGKFSFWYWHSVFIPGPLLQLFTPLNSQQAEPISSQNPQLQLMHVGSGSRTHSVLSGHAEHGSSLQVHSAVKYVGLQLQPWNPSFFPAGQILSPGLHSVHVNEQ